MEKYAVDLDKVLDEFEFNEDRAEQFATILTKRNSSIAPTPPIVGAHVLHQSTAAYRRPAFEPINLADADFAADLQISAPCYNSAFSTAANSLPGPPTSEGNIYMSHSENINKNNEKRLSNDTIIDCRNSELEWHNIVTSTFCRNGRVDVAEIGPNSEGVNDRLESSTNKINVSGVFTSLNEYINAGSIEAKLSEVNPSSHRNEQEKDNNFALSNSRFVASTITNHQPSLFYQTTSDVNVKIEKLGDNVNIDSIWKNNNEEVGFTGNKWTDTIDVCKVSENNSKSSFADLIPTVYSKSLQEDARDVASASSDETPDLLDRTVITNKSATFAGSENEDGVHANESSVINSENFDLEDASQPNLSQLPDVASSGRSAFKANMRSDLIASHGAVECSDDENVDQNMVEILDSQKSSALFVNETEETDVDVTETVRNESCPDVETNISQCRDTSSEATKVAPVGFNALEELSDAELHQYLEELEDNELNSESGQDDLEEVGDTSVLENQADLQEITEKENDPVISCAGDEKSKELSIHTKVICENSEEVSQAHDMNSSSIEISAQQFSDNISSSQDSKSVIVSDEKVSFVAGNELESTPNLNSASEPRTDALQSVACNSVSPKKSGNVFGAETSGTSNVPATSKSASAINNLVSIDCHQINRTVGGSSDSTEIKTEDNVSPECLEKGPSSDTLNNSSVQQDSIETGQKDSEIKFLSTETGTCEKTENKCSESSIPNVTGVKDDTIESVSKIVPEGTTEIEYSEVPSCLVRMPKDGSTINVLGEEERPSRPKYLFLPSKITVENEQDESGNSEVSPPLPAVVGPPGETPGAETHKSCVEREENTTLSSPDASETSSVEQAVALISSLSITTPLSEGDILSPEERSLGKLPPFWVPDGDAPTCMLCDVKFTVLKRRHHCRACGKVLCYKCCSLKSRLEYMENSEARVCQPCYNTLAKVLLVEQGESASGSPSSLNEGAASGSSMPLGRQPNPNNPMEYCSTIPPLEQAASVLKQPPPSVLVPVGVLKREGSTRSRSDVTKQVIFSDGIRPGGDLTELDGSSEPRLPYRRPGRMLKRVGTPPGPPSAASNLSQRHLPLLDPNTMSYIPTDKGLPPLAVITKGEIKFEDVVDHEKLMTTLRSETELPPVFAINRNLFITVKIINLDCCVNRTCWCFTTAGMNCVGQDEIVIILECLPEEATIPKDIFKHINTLYQDASRGNTVSEMGHTVFQGAPFLDSVDHGGFIYIRPSFQCLQKLILPPSPYLVGILVHRWETPWATVFPIRLMLRLGAEYRYYPCMLVSVRNRKAVYWDIGHTIINLLADFRNLSYTLPSVRGMVIHMEDRQTSILLPRNRYDQVTRALNNSNDHVLALASNFSFQADSHLVCIQSESDESYHTQAINIHNKPRKVTGASFVVFNGALKTSSNLTAKSSIVEDGLMVQITSDTMQALRAALRNMQDFNIGCGPAGASEPDELVTLKWVQDDKNFNVGVKSNIDGRPLDGIPSIRVHNGTDYMGSCRFIRWTEVFIIQSDEGLGRRGDPLDISRLSESLARATCLALIKLLDLLAQAGLTQLAIRATVHPENVGYEAGSGGEKLPPIYMDSLDNELVPVLHKAASMSQDNAAAILELIFHVMMQ